MTRKDWKLAIGLFLIVVGVFALLFRSVPGSIGSLLDNIWPMILGLGLGLTLSVFG